MASALFSSRRSSCPAAAGTANRNKTITICLSLGLILGAATSFFRPFQQDVHPCFGIRVLVKLKLKLRNMPEREPRRQFPPQLPHRLRQNRNGLVVRAPIAGR